jgi:hypothetical protein
MTSEPTKMKWTATRYIAGDLYLIVSNDDTSSPRRWWAYYQPTFTRINRGRKFSTLAEAFAACERHRKGAGEG